MGKIKVLHIITKLELGGAQQNTIYTVSNINSEDFIPVLVTGKGGILDSTVKNKSFKKYFVPSLVRSVNPFLDIVALVHIFFIIKIEKPEIIHTHSSKAGILGRWAGFLAKITGDMRKPVIVHTFHGFGFNDYQKKIVRDIFIMMERLTSIITDKFIAVANENIIKAQKYKIGSVEKYELIRSGIKITDFKNVSIDVKEKKRKLKIEENESVVLTIGPFKPQKNLVDFIHMAKIVSEKKNNVKFLIVGDGEQRRILEDLTRKFNLEHRIIFLGWRDDIAEIIKISDVFVMTSLWEGLPRSVVEAMVSGKPVVSYAVDGTKEVVKNGITGFLVQPKNYYEIAEKVFYLLSNTEIALKYGNTAKSLIDDEFNIDHMVKKQEKLYLTLLSIKNRRRKINE